jgi:hypothetical protein
MGSLSVMIYDGQRAGSVLAVCPAGGVPHLRPRRLGARGAEISPCGGGGFPRRRGDGTEPGGRGAWCP